MGNSTAINIHAMNWVLAMREMAIGEPSDQDKRIASLKSELRSLMGQDAFLLFYRTTSMNGDILEMQLLDRLTQVSTGF